MSYHIMYIHMSHIRWTHARTYCTVFYSVQFVTNTEEKTFPNLWFNIIFIAVDADVNSSLRNVIIGSLYRLLVGLDSRILTLPPPYRSFDALSTNMILKYPKNVFLFMNKVRGHYAVQESQRLQRKIDEKKIENALLLSYYV